MKTAYIFLVTLAAGLLITSCDKDEEKIDFITFEQQDLGTEGYWNGSDQSGGFELGNAFFPNSFTDWGDGISSWSGFAVSNHTDRSTPGYQNQYSAYTGGGANGSEQYGLVYLGDTLVFTVPEKLESMQVTNSTYAALSMAEGDDFSKKFVQGDYFTLVLTGIDEEGWPTGIINIGLADYTSEYDSLHYITNVWNLIELDFLGVVKKLAFSFESSDTTGIWINTPAYVCIDNIKGVLQE